MSTIIVGRATETPMNLTVLNAMFRFRAEVFHKRLGWEVKVDNGLERDWYDDLQPFYMVSCNESGQINGCLRLLPTTGPYMLKNTFPVLLQGKQPPQHPEVWELSRFAVVPSVDDNRPGAQMSYTTLKIIQSVIRFADHYGIRQYVAVTSVALERLLLKIGIPLYRFGNGKAQWLGKVLSVVCLIPVNDAFRQAVRKILST